MCALCSCSVVRISTEPSSKLLQLPFRCHWTSTEAVASWNFWLFPDFFLPSSFLILLSFSPFACISAYTFTLKGVGFWKCLHVVFDSLFSRIRIWKCWSFLEQKMLTEYSFVHCICSRLDSGTMKLFHLPNKQTSFFTGSMNQMKIKFPVIL